MDITEAKLKVVVFYSLEYGEEKTCDDFSLTNETLRRYKREYKKKYGQGIKVLEELRNNYSDEELKLLVSSKKKHVTV